MVDECRVCGPPPLTRVCRILIIANVAAWAVLLAVGAFADPLFDWMTETLALIPERVVSDGHVWQLVTSMFLHLDPWHILFNMIGLYFFGPTLELRLGPKAFTRLFFVSGIVGSVCTVALAYLAPRLGLVESQVLGASGAIFGLLAVYATVSPDQIFLVFFMIPMRARNMAILFIALDAYFLILGRGGVAYSAHLGGALGGWLYYRWTSGRPPGSGFGRRRLRVVDEHKVIDARFRRITRDL